MKNKSKPIVEETTAPQDIAGQNTASYEVYRQLRADICTCKLKPNERLRFDKLRSDYQAGIGTLREALSHLVSDGLVRVESARGYRVAPVSISDLTDISFWRAEFESRAVLDAMERGDETWEAEIVTAFHLLIRTDLPSYDSPIEVWTKFAERHQRFHDSLAAACSSPWLLHFRNSLFDQARRYQALVAIRGDQRVNRSADEHRAIMEAVLARDKDIAAKLIEEHISSTAETVIELLTASEALEAE